jgi:Protein of unknown function (DUF3500)
VNPPFRHGHGDSRGGGHEEPATGMSQVTSPPRQHPAEMDPTRVTFAAMSFFDGLTAGQREQIVLPFADQNRRNWNFLPESGRRGLPLKALTHQQTLLAHQLIAQSVSMAAYARILQAISLENILREINLEIFGHVARDFRDPGNYVITLFGQPNPDSVWGWRLVGHHVSVNVVVVNQDHLAITPFMIGSEPGRFGPYRILGEEEDLGFALLDALPDEQREIAVIHHRPPADFVTRTVPRIGDIEIPGHHGVGRRDALINDDDRHALRYIKAHPRGIRAGALSGTARQLFDQLLGCYVQRARQELADREMDRIRAHGYEDLHFAWAGGQVVSEPHYYRIQGPVTLIEFDNAEDQANHVHTVWRDPGNDFGDDLLTQYYRDHHALTSVR